MRKLTSAALTAAMATGLLLGSSALALADDNHSTHDDHSAQTCSAEHGININLCSGHLFEFDSLHLL